MKLDRIKKDSNVKKYLVLIFVRVCIFVCIGLFIMY